MLTECEDVEMKSCYYSHDEDSLVYCGAGDIESSF